MLRADRVSRRYERGGRRIEALRDVCVQVEPGQRLGLVGASGAGKSTLGRLLALLEAPDSGTIELDGEPVVHFGLRAPPLLRRRVQLVWQSARMACDPRMRLQEILLEPLRLSGQLNGDAVAADAEARRWWEAAGLVDELRARFPHEVSDGQLQRVCIARALIVQPAYLVLDEPTSALDVSTQAALLALVADAQRETDLGVVLITHDRELVEHWCSEIVQLDA